jgi:hypothetical protein
MIVSSANETRARNAGNRRGAALHRYRLEKSGIRRLFAVETGAGSEKIIENDHAISRLRLDRSVATPF